MRNQTSAETLECMINDVWLNQSKQAYKKAHDGETMSNGFKDIIIKALKSVQYLFPYINRSVCGGFIAEVIPSMISTDLLMPHSSSTDVALFSEYGEDGKANMTLMGWAKWYASLNQIHYEFPNSYQKIISLTEKDYGEDKDFSGVISMIQNKLDALVVSKIMSATDECKGEVWNIDPSQTQSISEHYKTFSGVLENNCKTFYNRLNIAVPSYILIPRSMIKVFRGLDEFKEANTHADIGFFYFGRWNNIKVFVAPIIEDGSYILGASHTWNCAVGFLGFGRCFLDAENAIKNDCLYVDEIRTQMGINIVNPGLLMRCKVIGAECSGEDNKDLDPITV